MKVDEELQASSSHAGSIEEASSGLEQIDWVRSAPFLLIHFACLAVFWVGISPAAVIVCLSLYWFRMFGITAGYHRYFSHRSFKTTRAFQFVLGWIGAMATQKGPLWWAANHRHHHATSDSDEDAHSPRHGFWWSHVGWFLCNKFHETNYRLIPDLAKFRELRFLNRCYVLPPISLGAAVAMAGWALHRWFPGLHTSPLQMLVWGFFVSTTLLYHGTFAVNSLAHVIGRVRFATKDDSKNSLLIAIVTLGEGWHNNHHFVPSSERQGFYWWEVDVTHYVLKLLSWMGVVWDLKKPPRHIYALAKTP
ncbi:MAG: acyl-CoA desaturase [Acidobacteriaceae bacterium]|nr:acyl-CoA desaturase [Acidobacteriaceae bacterium]